MPKQWSARQRQVIEWLATPKFTRQPPTQQLLAEHLGLAESTISRWKKNPEFTEAVLELARGFLRNDLPEIYGAIAREAIKGSFPHAKLAMELTGEYVERSQVEQTGEVTLNVVYAEPQD